MYLFECKDLLKYNVIYEIFILLERTCNKGGVGPKEQCFNLQLTFSSKKQFYY